MIIGGEKKKPVLPCLGKKNTKKKKKKKKKPPPPQKGKKNELAADHAKTRRGRKKGKGCRPASWSPSSHVYSNARKKREPQGRGKHKKGIGRKKKVVSCLLFLVVRKGKEKANRGAWKARGKGGGREERKKNEGFRLGVGKEKKRRGRRS